MNTHTNIACFINSVFFLFNVIALLKMHSDRIELVV